MLTLIKNKTKQLVMAYDEILKYRSKTLISQS